MFTPAWSVVPGEVATATKFSQLGANDDYLLDRVENASAAGMISAFPVSTPPAGWLLCDGSAVSRSTYADLFAVIGVSRGEGDGVNTFNLPNYKGRTIVGVNPDDGDLNVAGKQYGQKNVTLSEGQMPAHQHGGTTSVNGDHTHRISISITTGTGAGGDIRGVNQPSNGLSNYSSTVGGNHNHSFATDWRGGNQAHNNMQPSTAEYIIIKY